MVGLGGPPTSTPSSSISHSNDTAQQPHLVGTPHIRGPPWLRLPLLALGFFGFQMVWSIEMAYGTPFLLELGLSKPTMALVFIAGPISGLVVQPLIGSLADGCTHPWGRRRPYLVASTLVTACFVLLFGFARVGPAWVGLDADGKGWATPVLAVVGIWGMDFAVNALMAVDRALLLDMLPAEKQAEGTAWSARLAALGAILGFFVGDVDLPSTAPFSWFPSLLNKGPHSTPSEAQVRCLSLITAFALVATHAAVAWCAVEQRLVAAPEQQRHSSRHRSSSSTALSSALSSAQDILQVAYTLPSRIRLIFAVQICSWISWFPIMFYATEWIATAIVGGSDRARGTRAGSHAMFLQAVVSFACSVGLPLLLRGSGEDDEGDKGNGATWLTGLRHRLPRTTLLRLWLYAHLSLATLLVLGTGIAQGAHSLRAATFIAAGSGFAWAVANWAPYALIGIFLQQGEDSGGEGRDVMALGGSGRGAYEPVRSGDEDDGGDDDVTPRPSPSPPASSSRAGSIVGLHNVSIVVPQMTVSMTSSLVFALFPDDGGANTLGWIIRLGGLSSLGAAYLTWRLERNVGTQGRRARSRSHSAASSSVLEQHVA